MSLVAGWRLAALAALLVPAGVGARVLEIQCQLGVHLSDGRTHELEDGIPLVLLHWSLTEEAKQSGGYGDPQPRLDLVRLTQGLPAPDGFVLEFKEKLKHIDLDECRGHNDLFTIVRNTPHELFLKPAHDDVVVRLWRNIHSVIALDRRQVQDRIDRAGSSGLWDEMEALTAAAKYLNVAMDGEYQKELAYFNGLRDRGFREYGDKRYADAVQHLDPVVEERPQDFEAALTLAKAQYQLARYGAARERLERLLEQNPRHPETLLYLGLVELTADELGRAEKHLRQAHAAGARDAPFFLGFTLYRRDDFGGAKVALQEFLARNPGSDLAPRARALLDTLARPPVTRVADGDPPPARSGDRPRRDESPPPARVVETDSPSPRAELEDGLSLAASPLILRGFRRPSLELAEGRDRAAVVHLWASWCGPCLHELPSLIEFHEQSYPELREAGLELVILSVDHDEADLTRYVDDRLPSLARLPLYWDPNWTLATELELDSALPKTLLIGRGGRVIRIQEGPLDWRSAELAAELRALAEAR